jgi:glycosyltransferase involved in cell wall biosynthesis
MGTKPVEEVMLDKILDVSVVICAYTQERWQDLIAAVESVQHQTLLPCEIVVVIDHNPQLLQLARANLLGTVVIENQNTQGLSGARNSGLAIARGAFIAFLDDDATAEKDWLELLYRSCQDSDVLGVGGTVEPHWLSRQPVWFPREFYWVLGCTYQCLPEQPMVVRNPFGGCTCYRMELFEVVGGFRSEIGRVGKRPLGCEETELCIRARQHWPQKKFLYEPRAKIHHRIPFSRTTWRYFRSRCYAEGLSKAVVTKFVGAGDGLSTERTYMLRALPYGVWRGLVDGFVRLDFTGLLRAGAIIAGLGFTIAGYITGTYFKMFFKLHFSTTQSVPKKEVTYR